MGLRAWLGAALLLAAACSSRGPASPPGFALEAPAGATPWTRLEPLGDPGEFHFAILADRTGGHRAGVFEEAVRKLNWLRPAFVVSVGDLIEGYSEDPADLGAEWDEFEGLVGRLEMPFFHVPGNHDMSNRVMAEAWRERFGPSYYHFEVQGVLFVVLNSELFGMAIERDRAVEGPDGQAAQMAFVERVLAEHRDARWTFLFLHQPLWDLGEIHPDWLRVEALLGQRPYSAFGGHIHAYTYESRHGRSFITLATTGGESELRGLAHGEFDHVAWVSMTRDGPRIANLMLEGIQGPEVRTKAVRRVVRQLEAAVRAEPVAAGTGRFERGVARFSVRNDGDEPLELAGSFEGGRDLELSPARLTRRVEPRSQELVEVEVRAARRVPLQELEPGAARWTLATRAPGDERVEVESRSAIVPERPFACARPARPPVLDGRLEEWGALPFAMTRPAQLEHGAAHAGPADASFRFAVACDEAFVHVAVDVMDDDVQLSPALAARSQDGVSLVLDGRPDPERSRNQGFWQALRDGSLREMALASAAPVSPKRDSASDSVLPEPSVEVRSASQRTERGYAVEFAIPVAWLAERQGGSWSALRLELGLRDFDAGDSGHALLWWRPTRFGPMALPGSGSFVRVR